MVKTPNTETDAVVDRKTGWPSVYTQSPTIGPFREFCAARLSRWRRKISIPIRFGIGLSCWGFWGQIGILEAFQENDPEWQASSSTVAQPSWRHRNYSSSRPVPATDAAVMESGPFFRRCWEALSDVPYPLPPVVVDLFSEDQNDMMLLGTCECQAACIYIRQWF